MDISNRGEDPSGNIRGNDDSSEVEIQFRPPMDNYSSRSRMDADIGLCNGRKGGKADNISLSSQGIGGFSGGGGPFSSTVDLNHHVDRLKLELERLKAGLVLVGLSVDRLAEVASSDTRYCCSDNILRLMISGTSPGHRGYSSVSLDGSGHDSPERSVASGSRIGFHNRSNVS